MRHQVTAAHLNEKIVASLASDDKEEDAIETESARSDGDGSRGAGESPGVMISQRETRDAFGLLLRDIE